MSGWGGCLGLGAEAIESGLFDWEILGNGTVVAERYTASIYERLVANVSNCKVFISRPVHRAIF